MLNRETARDMSRSLTCPERGLILIVVILPTTCPFSDGKFMFPPPIGKQQTRTGYFDVNGSTTMNGESHSLLPKARINLRQVQFHCLMVVGMVIGTRSVRILPEEDSLPTTH